MALEAGTRVGDYEILSLLGTGGMGQVYSARSIISGRVEAMKVLLPDFAAEPDLAARFTAEIRILAALEHPNIAQLRTAFEFDSRLIMIMEFVEGVTLEKRATEAPIPLDEVLNYSSQVLAALSYAHSKGVTHRDIKPANIMITSHGLVKLMDFGIAKSATDLQLTRPGTTLGSVYYMSPEQVRGGTVDARSDIYSFGATLYEMLTGRRPFQAETAYSVLNAQLNEAPEPPSQVNPALSPELNNIVLRAMVKSPDGRFQTADEFRAALRNLKESSAGVTTPQFAPVPAAVASPAATPANNHPKGHRGLWIGLGAAAAIIAMIAAGTFLPRMLTTHASQKSATPVTESAPASQPSASGNSNAAAQPAPQSPSTPAVTPPSSAAANAAAAPSPPVPPPASSAHSHAHPSQPATSAAENAPVDQPPPGPSQQEINRAHQRMIELGSKADAAKAGVEQIRSQQQAQGLDIRGDILASMNRMNAYLNEAERALSQNDLQAANDNMDRAEKELATLDTFLGR
jgi:eukaryotic-like serine/threonine-protein kinase